MNLFERIENLCTQKGVNITEMCKCSGVTRSKLTDLKMGRIKSLSTGALSKIADYLDVTVDYLLGKEETKKSSSVSDEEIKFALFGGEGEITDEMWQAVREYAQFIKDKHGKK